MGTGKGGKGCGDAIWLRCLAYVGFITVSTFALLLLGFLKDISGICL